MIMPLHTWEFWNQMFKKFALQIWTKLLHLGWLVFQCVEHGLKDLFKQLNDGLKQCSNTQMQATKDITNRCPIHLVIKNISIN